MISFGSIVSSFRHLAVSITVMIFESVSSFIRLESKERKGREGKEVYRDHDAGMQEHGQMQNSKAFIPIQQAQAQILSSPIYFCGLSG